jgi:hypothetical protein
VIVRNENTKVAHLSSERRRSFRWPLPQPLYRVRQHDFREF